MTYRRWGEEIDEGALEQMRAACRLPVAVAGALMPDAHVGYGLPIGGVLATEGAVIPYAVGVDIACRMMMTVFDVPAEEMERRRETLRDILETSTRFGVGAAWKRERPQHEVMDEDWGVTPVTAGLKDKAWSQLGTSGSGNHFVEWGELALCEGMEESENAALEPLKRAMAGGCRLIALLSHSGSRGAGAQVCAHYSRVARERHGDLAKEQAYLAWLDVESEGGEYWAAMELMGRYASANHHVIHEKIARAFGAGVVMQVENHHNFAWKERHTIGGREREVIVHRKGATPAGRGVLGLIPGSMAAPGYLVEGLGEAGSLRSASHGAGRRLSRKKAREAARWSRLREELSARGVEVLSAGLDECPAAYKDIEEVMGAQRDLVRAVAKFMPRIVKMAPEGERPED